MHPSFGSAFSGLSCDHQPAAVRRSNAGAGKFRPPESRGASGRARSTSSGQARRERAERIERATSEALECRRLFAGFALTALASFDGINESIVNSNLVMDSSGNLFGTSAQGGASMNGTVFELAKGSSTATTVATFNGTNGSTPTVGVIIDSAGNLYGVTMTGGSQDVGTVFEVVTGSSTITTLATFNGINGRQPQAGLLMDTSGNLYGTTSNGGANFQGSVFELAKGSGTITNLASFNNTDGADPNAGVIMDSSGNLFGTTVQGGTATEGVVYEVVKGSGAITELGSLQSNINGSDSVAPLVMDTSGNLYGTTANGGGVMSNGSIFEVPKGSTSISRLASFTGPDGANPVDALFMDSAGDLFGTTNSGGPAYTTSGTGDGVVFELPKGGSIITVLASFNGTNGQAPFSGLLPDSAGNFYGTTLLGGANSAGVVFEFSPIPGPVAALDFITPPSPAVAGASISPAVTVKVVDSSGVLEQADSSSVTLSIASGPAGAVLGGTVTANAVNGVATFSNLSLNEPGAYTLTATDGALTTATSASFNITLGGAAEVAVSTLPATTVAGAVISPAVTATVENSNGILIPTDTSAVTVSIASGPAGAVLGGTLTASVVNGVATFSNLSFSLPGTYTLQATDGILTAGISAPATVFAPARIGGLDPNFGVGGLASHNVGMTTTAGVVVQGDGKSIIAGTAGSAGAGAFGLTRYNADGSLDTTFGTNGATQTPFAGDVQAAAEILLANGDILIAGTDTTLVNGQATGSQFALAEYTSAGALDTTFGNGAGFVLTSFSSTAGTLSNDIADALAIGPDGTIYVGGSSDVNGHGLDFAIAAYTPSGSPSPAFGANGKVLLDFAGGDDSIAALSLSAKGALIAAGSAIDPSTGVSSVALAEFLPTGALDTKFGVKGKVVTTVGSVDDAASSLAIDAKGDIIVGGYSGTGSAAAATLSADFLLLRYAPTGKLDKMFGKDGIVTTSFNQPAAVTSVLIDADGTITASGKTVASLATLNVSELDLAVARYTANGRLDTTFNGNGQLIVSLASGTEQPAFIRSTSETPFDASSDLKTAFKQLTKSDQGVIAMTSGGELLDAGNNGGDTVEAAIVATGLDLMASFLTALPQSVVGGGKGTATISIGEAGTTLASGTFSVELFASSSPNLSTGEAPFQTFPEKLKLKSGKAKSLHLKFAYPSSLSDGNYYVVATVETGTARDLNPLNNTSASASSVLIAKPFVQLDGSALIAPAFHGTKPASVSFTITNAGNITASAKSAVQFFASTTGTLTGAIALTTTPLHLSLKPGAPHPFKVMLALPVTLPAATYTLLALLDPANVFNDPNAATNFIVSGNMFTVA